MQEPANSLAVMRFPGFEDRLNPVTREGIDEGTLGGYPAVHGRAPGFEGSDGHPYTVAIESESADDGSGHWVAYLVFVRWASGGSAIMGHLESDDLVRGPTQAAVLGEIEGYPLDRVKEVLEELIATRQELERES